jgi:hypothetical protein
MNLGEGSNYKHLFCEVSEGGFVAYLISATDTEIENPLARIHIRRFVNQDGVSIAKPEKTIYGNEVPGFLEAVTSWVENNNQERMSKLNLPEENVVYKRKGGDWSDTYGDVFAVPPKSISGLFDWVKGNVPNTKEEKWELTDNYYEELNDAGYWDRTGINLGPDYDGSKTFDSEIDALTFKSRLEYLRGGDWMDYFNIDDQYSFELNEDGDIDEEEYEKELDRVRSGRFTISKVTSDSTNELRIKAFKEIMNSDMNLDMNLVRELEQFLKSEIYFPEKSNYFITFYSKYPQLLTEEQFNNLYTSVQTKIIENIKSTNPKEYERLNQDLINKYINDLSFESVKNKIKPNSSYDSIYALNDLIEPDIEINTDELYNATKEYIFNTAGKVLNDPKKYSAFLSIATKSMFNFHKFKDEYLIDFVKEAWKKINRSEWRGLNNFSVYSWVSMVRSININKKTRPQVVVFLPYIRDLLVNAERDIRDVDVASQNKYLVDKEYLDKEMTYRKEVLNDLIDDIEYFSKQKEEELS